MKCYITGCEYKSKKGSYFCSEDCRSIYWGSKEKLPPFMSWEYIKVRMDRIKKNANL